MNGIFVFNQYVLVRNGLGENRVFVSKVVLSTFVKRVTLE